jgi:hypothetical protein
MWLWYGDVGRAAECGCAMHTLRDFARRFGFCHRRQPKLGRGRSAAADARTAPLAVRASNDEIPNFQVSKANAVTLSAKGENVSLGTEKYFWEQLPSAPCLWQY